MKTYATLGPACCRADLLTELLDMGLTPGVRVRLIGTALFGDPLILLGRRRCSRPGRRRAGMRS